MLFGGFLCYILELYRTDPKKSCNFKLKISQPGKYSKKTESRNVLEKSEISDT